MLQADHTAFARKCIALDTATCSANVTKDVKKRKKTHHARSWVELKGVREGN